MHRFIAFVLSCLIMLGVFAAAAPAATTATWAPNMKAGGMLAPQSSAGPSDLAQEQGVSRTATRGLAFLRSSAYPTWLVDVMRELIPWRLGGSATHSAAVAERPITWVSRDGGTSNRVGGSAANTDGSTSVDDYSDLWTGSKAAEPRGGELELAYPATGTDDVAVAYGGRFREYDRGDLPLQEPHDDRADDRYHDGR
ncbi:MAG: hypothetical protein ABIG03_06970 [Candidatus Eisenbacteria bacterium]